VNQGRPYGTQDERIYVEFSHAKLATLGIPAGAVRFARQAEQLTPAGTVETSRSACRCASPGADGAKAVAENPC